MPPESTSQELDYEDLIDLLPEEYDGDSPNRRKHNLTRSDLVLIGRMIEAKGGHRTCSQFTQEEIVLGKKIIKAFNKVAAGVGMLVILSIVGFIITIFSKGFWTRLGEIFLK